MKSIKKALSHNRKERKQGKNKVCRREGTTPHGGDSEERELRQSAAAQQVNVSPVPKVSSCLHLPSIYDYTI